MTWFSPLFCQQSVWSWWTAEKLNWAAGCPTPPKYTEWVIRWLNKTWKGLQLFLWKAPRSYIFGVMLSPPLGSRCVFSKHGAPGCQEHEDETPQAYRWFLVPYWLKSQVESSWSWGSHQTPGPPTGQRGTDVERQTKIKYWNYLLP